MKVTKFINRRLHPAAAASTTRHLDAIEHLVEVIGETEDAADLRILMHTLRFVRGYVNQRQDQAA